MRTFYTFISRVLLVVFMANCLLPSVTWAQRSRMRQGGSSVSREKILSELENSKGRNGQRQTLRDLDLEQAPIQRDGHLAHQLQVREITNRAAKDVAERAEKTYQTIQKKAEEQIKANCPAQIEQAYNDYLNATELENIIGALNKLYLIKEECEVAIRERPNEFIKPIADAGKYFFEDYFEKEFNSQTSSVESLVEFADPIAEPDWAEDGRWMQMSEAAQIIAQSFAFASESKERIDYNPEIVHMLERVQLRLLHHLSGYSMQDKAGNFVSLLQTKDRSAQSEKYDAAQQKYEQELAAWQKEEQEARQALLNARSEASGREAASRLQRLSAKPTKPVLATYTYPQSYEEFTFRGWARLALVRIHKTYDLMSLPDPLGKAYLNLQKYAAKKEFEQAKAQSSKSEKATNEYALVSMFETMFALENHEDIKQLIHTIEPSSKRGNFLHGENAGISTALSIVKDTILGNPQSDANRALFNDMLEMVQSDAFAVPTQRLALQALADLKEACNGNCNMLFTDSVKAQLSCRAAEMYEPLVAERNYKSYGLDVGQMAALSDMLKNMYLTFEGNQHFLDWKKGEVYGIIGMDYYNGHPIPQHDPSVFDVESVNDTFASYTADQLATQKAWMARKCNGQETVMFPDKHRNWSKESADYNAAFLDFFLQMIVFDGVFRIITPIIRTVWGVAVARPLKTLRGVMVSTPDAVKAAKAGEGLAGVAREVKQGVRLSNIGGNLSAGQRAGISLNATYTTATGAQKTMQVGSYRQLVGLRNKNLIDLSLWQNGIREYTLGADAMQQFSSVGRNSTWKFLTQDMNPLVAEPLGMKALTGSSFRRWNPALQEASQNLLRSKALLQMAEEGGFDVWIGTRPVSMSEGATIPYSKYNWFNASEGKMTDFITAFSRDNIQSMQIALAPRYISNPSLFPKSYTIMGINPSAPATLLPEVFGKQALESEMRVYLALSEAEKMSLLGDFILRPELFRVKDATIVSALKNLGSYVVPPEHIFGGWVGTANRFLVKTGQSGLPSNLIMDNLLPFREMWANMGLTGLWWGGFVAADGIAYGAGMQDWVKNAAKRDEKKLMDQLPEISASSTAENQGLNEVVTAAADPQMQGTLVSSSITMARYGLGKMGVGNFAFISPEAETFAKFNEDRVHFYNLTSFKQMYDALNNDFTRIVQSNTSSQATVAVAQKYSAELEAINNNNSLYSVKAEKARRLFERWQTEYGTRIVSDRVTSLIEQIDSITKAGYFNTNKAQAWIARAQEISRSEASFEEKIQALSVLEVEAGEAYLENVFMYVPVRKTQEIAQKEGFNFDEEIARYRNKISKLLATPTVTQEELEREYTKFVDEFEVARGKNKVKEVEELIYKPYVSNVITQIRTEIAEYPQLRGFSFEAEIAAYEQKMTDLCYSQDTSLSTILEERQKFIDNYNEKVKDYIHSLGF